mgnify:CR=1 FL=1
MKYIFILASSSVLDASKGVDLGQFIQVILGTVCLLIDSVVYWVTSLAFKLFLAISQFELFNTSTFNDIIDRTYVVIGVVSLFLVAYALLNAIINPDNFSKGDKSISKIVKNLIIAVIGIAIVPTLFNYFYYFQKVILCNNTIPKLLLKNVSDDGNTVENTAKEFSALVFESFFYPNAASSVGDEAVDLTKAAASVKLEKKDPYYEENKNDSDYNDDGYYSLLDAYFNAEKGRSFWISFSPFLLGEGFANGIVDNSVQYLVILSTIAGGYIAYVMISLCIDMGMRAVKLGYLELIAPLAIMTTIVPGKDSVYKNWIKKTTSCALEVFTRLFVVVFAVYLINTIKDMNLPTWISSVCGITLWPIAGLLLRTLIIASIFAFIKQAPKFFSEATGIKSDGFKIGIMDKLKENGMLQGLGAAGGGITAGVRNMAPGVAKGFATGGVGGAFLGGLKSIPTGLAGAASGTRRGWNKAKEAKKWSDVKTAAGDAADEAMEAKFKRQEYKENHGGTTRGVIEGHVNDIIDKIKDYPKSYEAEYKHLQNVLKPIKETSDAQKNMTDAAKNYVDKHEKDIVVDKFEFKDAQGGTHTITGNTEKLSKFKQIAEDAEKIANSTGDVRDIEHARSVKNQYNAAKKAAEMGALSGRFETNKNGISQNEIDSEIFASIQSYHSYITKNRDTILNNSGLDRSSLEFTNLANSLDTIIGLDLSHNDLRNAANRAAFENFEKQLKRKATINGQEIEIGSFIATTTAKNNVSAEANALLDKINEKQDKK